MGLLTKKEQSLLDALEPTAKQNDIEIVTVEVIGSKKAPVIRIYIDAAGGVSFQELSGAQEWIGEMLDRIDPFPGAYTLEVSSPGIDRPLRTPEHFRRFAGEEVSVRTARPLEGRSSFKGTLVSATDDEVVVETEDGPRTIPLSEMKRAHVIGKIEF